MATLVRLFATYSWAASTFCAARFARRFPVERRGVGTGALPGLSGPATRTDAVRKSEAAPPKASRQTAIGRSTMPVI